MHGEARNPAADRVPIERWIEKDAPMPRSRKAVIEFGVIVEGAIPRPRIRRSRVEIEGSKPIDDPVRRDVDLRSTNRLLMRTECHLLPLGLRDLAKSGDSPRHGTGL